MRRYSSISKKTVTAICGAICFLPLTLIAACTGNDLKPFSQYSEYAIKAASADDNADAKWAGYLKSHFQKRATDRDCVLSGQAQDDSQLQITVDMDPQMPTDYAVTIASHQITLKARNTEAMLWLQYQFMSKAASEDNRFTATDLPPAMIDCRTNTSGSFAFEYRSLYTPTNTNADMMPIMGVGNVDFDWGLWGHNLKKIFTDGIPTDAQAMINGKRSSNQFCFSSEALYHAYEQFVIDQYGDGSDGITTRFAVMPNDNTQVCQCAACKTKGNTTDNATPAVTALIQRLAKRFPRQMFFTSAYATTRKVPTGKLPANVGVIISAIDMPMMPKIKGSKEQSALESQTKEWQQHCNHVYIWDYMRNFDDYLTPYPCLHHLQSRLQYYRSIGINGIFINGSGYDYAPFDDVQTYVLAQMLINPDIDIEGITAQYFATAYPKTGNLLANYYTSLEKDASEHTLPFYGGITDELGVYIKPQELIHFIAATDRASKVADSDERTKLNQLLTALAYTRLEIFRTQDVAPDHSQIESQTYLLSQHTAFDNMGNYRESNGDIDNYLKQWTESFPWLDTQANLLDRGALETSSADGNARLLTDGKQGFVTDYHLGWFISPAPTLTLTTRTELPASVSFSLSALHAPEWHIYAPSAVEIRQNGKVKGRTNIKAPSANGRVKINVKAAGLQPGVKTEINIVQTTANTTRRTMAIDEIWATK